MSLLVSLCKLDPNCVTISEITKKHHITIPVLMITAI